MAQLNTRILLKYDSYTNWVENNPTLLAGEIAIAKLVTGTQVDVSTDTTNTAPVMFKVGPGKFNDLPWASATAADVYGWAKMKYEDFTAKLATDLKLATNDQIEALAGKVTDLEGVVGDSTEGLVKDVTDNTTAINNEITRATGAEETLAGRLDVVEPKLVGIGGTDEPATVIAAVNGAKAYTDTEVGKVDAKVTDNTTAITLLNGNDTTAGSVAHTVKTAVDAEAQARTEAVNDLDARLDVIEGEATVEGSIKKALADANTYTDGKVATINGNVTDLTGRVAANEEAIATLNGTGTGSVQDTVDKAINKFATDVTNDDVVNSYKELIDYAAEHGEDFAELVGIVTQQGKDIEANTGAITDNKTAIENNDADILELQGKVSTLEGKVDVTSVAGAINTAKTEAINTAAEDATTKANTAETNAKTHADNLNSAINGRVTDIEAQLAGVGDGTVANNIATAKQEAIDAAATDATTKANTAETNAKAYADTKKTEANAYTDAEIDKVEGAINDLHTVAKTGNFTDLNDMSENTTDYVIIYCGTASIFADNQ